MTRAAPLIAAAVFLAASLAFRLEPARVVISGDDAPAPARIEASRYPGALRTMSAEPTIPTATVSGSGTVTSITATSPYLRTVAVPCLASTTSAATGGICYTTVPVSQ